MSSEFSQLPRAPLAGEATPVGTADRPAYVRASVCAGDATTAYLRTGAGPVVVILGARIQETATNPLIGLVADRHRVVIPDLSPTNSGLGHGEEPYVEFSEWLRSFLDGLGATDVVLVASDDLAPSAVAFARTDSDRIRRVVLSTRVDTRDGEGARCADDPGTSPHADSGDAHELRRPRAGGGGGQ